MAMTTPERVFGKQAWLGALDGTRLGREIEHEFTEGTRPPFPLTSGIVTPGEEPVPPASSDRRARRQARRARRRRQRHALRLLAGAGFRLPRVRRRLRTSGSSVLNLDPLEQALHEGTNGIGAVDPALIARPGLELRLAVTALRAGVLRYVTQDGTLVEADARTPAPAASVGPVGLVDAAIASASVPMVFPPHSMADDDYVDGGVIEIVPVRAAVQLGATRIFAVVALPLRAAPRRARLCRRPGQLHRPAGHGHDRHHRSPDGEPAHAPARRHQPDHDRPRGRRGRPLRPPAWPPAHQQGLRVAPCGRRAGRGRSGPAGGRGRFYARARRCPAPGLAPRALALGHQNAQGWQLGGRHPVAGARAEGARRARPSSNASSSGSPCPTDARPGGPSTSSTWRSARPTFPSRPSRRPDAPAFGLRRSARPTSPGAGTGRTERRRPRSQPRCRRPRRSTSARCCAPARRSSARRSR